MAEPPDPAAARLRDLLPAEDVPHTARDTTLPAIRPGQEAEAVLCQGRDLLEAQAITATQGTMEAVLIPSTAARVRPRPGARALLTLLPAARARPEAAPTACLQVVPTPAATVAVADTAAVDTAAVAEAVTVGAAVPVAAAGGNIKKTLNHEKNGYYYRLDGNMCLLECSGRGIPCLYV